MDCFSRKRAIHIPLVKGVEVSTSSTRTCRLGGPVRLLGRSRLPVSADRGLFARIPTDQPQLVVGDFGEEPNQAFATALY